MFAEHPTPDYRRLLETIGRREPDRVPLVEIALDPPIKEAFLGKPVDSVQRDVEFWWRAGYDYIYLRPGYEFPHTMPSNTSTGRPRYGKEEGDEPASVSVMGPGVIASLQDLDHYDWPNPETDAYYTPLLEAAECLPEGMGIITGTGGIFTRTWMLLGLENFCFALTEQPELVAQVFERVATIQLAVLRKLVQMPKVVAIWCGDDLAYTEATMVAPAVYRKYLFPWMEQIAAIAHEAGMPFIFHSDGRLWEVIPDLIALGVNALHPIEPKAMDINEVKARYGDRLALFGNIDMDVLARGTPAQVKAQVRQRIADLAPGGGYAVGANPCVPYYVPLANYNAMREAVLEYGAYPIQR